MATQRYFIVSNPTSGSRGAPERANRLADLLRAAGHLVEARSTAADHNVFVGLGAGCAVIAVVGGDGTFHAAVNGDLAVPLAFLSAGTVNVLAAELRLPTDVEGCARVILAGRTRELPLLQAGERRRFVLFLEAGLAARTIAAVNAWRARSGRHGRLEFVPAFLLAMFATWGCGVSVEVADDDGSWRPRRACSNLLITRTRRYADRGRIPIDAHCLDPLADSAFEVLCQRSAHPLTHLLVTGIVAIGWLPRLEPMLRRLGLIERFRARRVRFKGRAARHVHVDAEELPAPSDPTQWIEVGAASIALSLRVG